MASSKWKRVQFFQSVSLLSDARMPKSDSASHVVANEEDARFIHEIPDYSFMLRLNDLFFIGSSRGLIFICINDRVKWKFRAYNHKLLVMTKSNKNSVFVTLGIDSDATGTKGMLKYWDSGDIGMTEPLSEVQIPEPVMATATCIAVSPDLRCFAVGWRHGQIYLLYTDEDRTVFKRRLFINDSKRLITGLHFLQSPAHYLLYVTSDASVCCFLLTERTDELREIEKDHGGLPNCSDVDPDRRRLIVALNDEEHAVSVFYADMRGATWALPGAKTWLRVYNQYTIVVTQEPHQQEVLFYDLEMKVVTYHAAFATIEHVLCENDSVYILATNNQKTLNLVRLTEIETQAKLEILFRKRLYDVAVSLAEQVGFDPAYVAEIVKLNAEHYYSKGDFEKSILFYIKTIGFYEASSVIIKFLEPASIEYLISYVEALHQKHKAEKEHTALLLNCYVHHKAIDKLKNFLSQSATDFELFDARTAIEVCCEVKHFELASELAKRFKMKRLYVKIKVEIEKEYGDAVAFIKTEMSPSDAARALKEHGVVLLKNCLQLTLEFIKGLCESLDFTGNLSRFLEETELDEQIKKEEVETSYEENKPVVPNTLTYRQVLECLISPLIDFPEHLEDFLKTMIEKTPHIDSFVYHRLFELYLLHRRQPKNQDPTLPRSDSWSESVELCEEKIEKLIVNARGRYDKTYLLMLLQMYEFPNGVVHLSQLLRISQELLNHYFTTDDYDNILSICKEFGRREPDIWVQALKYFSKLDKPLSSDYIHSILSELGRLDALPVPPLVILAMIKKNRYVTFGAVKHFYITYIKEAIESQLTDDKRLEENIQIATEMRAEMEKLQTQPSKFTNSRCNLCDQKLTTPSLHFLCSHSFHAFCITERLNECPICTPESQTVLSAYSELSMQKRDHGAFFKALEVSGDRFEVVAQYFARGLIPTA